MTPALRASILCFLLGLTATTASARSLEEITGDATTFGLPQTLVLRADEAPRIDGQADDAFWARTREGTFVHAISGGRAPVETSFRIGWDDEYLYVFLRAVERGQESLVVGPSTGPDGAVHNADAVEVFLQPGGSDTPYFQVAANPWGGYMSYRWWPYGEASTWETTGVVIAGHVDFDYWTLELAIPFTALGQPIPSAGDEWRANFCRSELPGSLQYAAWSSTGDGFQVPERFGRLLFVDDDRSAEASHTVSGTLLHEDGLPAIDIPVRGFGRVERTDSLGSFLFEDIMAGEQVLTIVSPSHETFHGRLVIDEPRIELEPLTLRPIDPYRPRWSLPVGGALRWLASSLEEPPEMDGAPPADIDLTSVDLLATPGEFESRALAFYSGRRIEAPTTTMDALAGPGGTIPASAIDIRWTQRLLKRFTYQTTQDHSEHVWRFLWREPPATIEAGQLRQLVVTVQIPDDTTPGIYAGNLTLSGTGGEVARLPISVRVGSFVLATPEDKRVGTFINGFEKFSHEWVERMLLDVRAHGGRKVKWWMQFGITEKDGQLEPDVRAVRENLKRLHRLGFEPPYTVGTAAESITYRLGIPGSRHAYDAEQMRNSDEYRQTYTRFVDAARELEAELAIGPFTLFWSDEIFQPGRVESWLVTAALTREATDQSIFITHHSGDREKIARIDPFTDIRCYHGRRLDDDYPSAGAYDDLRAELTASGDEAWAYYNVVRTDITSEFTRLVNGYWLWRTPVSVHLPWTYYYGDRDRMVGVREGTREAPFFAFAAPHPTKDELVSSLDWECFREGWDDLRYVTTLEHAIAEAPARKGKVAERGRQLLARWWSQDPRVTSQALALDAVDYQARRQQMFDLIEELR